MREMYFQPPLSYESQMEGAYANHFEEEFVECILQYFGLQKAKLIGEHQDGRSIYKLYSKNK